MREAAAAAKTDKGNQREKIMIREKGKATVMMVRRKLRWVRCKAIWPQDAVTPSSEGDGRSLPPWRANAVCESTYSSGRSKK